VTRLLTDAEFGEALATIERSAFRLELQKVYLEPSEVEILKRYNEGDRFAHVDSPMFDAWWAMLRRHTAAGRRVERVRVQEDPPTWYQEWERWVGRWNTTAGEHTRYMTRAKANEVGLLPAAGDKDWWLLDSNRLIVMAFDDEGHRLSNELVTDPKIVAQACTWRDLAIHHSILDEERA
jgi:Family of unknown function (DUF6879)